MKQYFKLNRALRTETTTPALPAQRPAPGTLGGGTAGLGVPGASVNNPGDFDVGKDVSNDRRCAILRAIGLASSVIFHPVGCAQLPL